MTYDGNTVEYNDTFTFAVRGGEGTLVAYGSYYLSPCTKARPTC